MSLARRAPRRDDNESDIVLALLGTIVPKCKSVDGCRCGVSVQSLSGSPGLVDLLVGMTWSRDGMLEESANELVEVKNRDGKGVKLTPDQKLWHRTWRGREAFLIETAEEVPALVGCIMGLANVVPFRRAK